MVLNGLVACAAALVLVLGWAGVWAGLVVVSLCLLILVNAGAGLVVASPATAAAMVASPEVFVSAVVSASAAACAVVAVAGVLACLVVAVLVPEVVAPAPAVAGPAAEAVVSTAAVAVEAWMMMATGPLSASLSAAVAAWLVAGAAQAFFSFSCADRTVAESRVLECQISWALGLHLPEEADSWIGTGPGAVRAEPAEVQVQIVCVWEVIDR